MYKLSRWILENFEEYVASLCIGATMFYWLEQGETIGIAFLLTMFTFWFPLLAIGLFAVLLEIISAFIPIKKTNH